MPSSVNEFERAPEGLAKARSIVAHYGQAAAPFWPIQGEGGNDGVPSGLQAPVKALDVSHAVTVFGEEVERRAVVPNVVSLQRLPDRRVRDNPMNLSSTDTKAGLSRF